MFEDQTVELLPARTVMTKCGSGGHSHRHGNSTTNVAIGGNGGTGGDGGAGGNGGNGGVAVSLLSGNAISLLSSGNTTGGSTSANGGNGGAGGAGGSANGGSASAG